jgi:hypothetical protein
MTCELVKLPQGTFQIDQRGRYHHHIEHGSMDGLEEASRETIALGLKIAPRKNKSAATRRRRLRLLCSTSREIQFALKYDF